MACEVDNRLFKICFYLCWRSTSFNCANHYMTKNLPCHFRMYRKKKGIEKQPNKFNEVIPVTLILLWKPKNTIGWSGVNAKWTSASAEICSVLFSGECRTRVCSVSKSHDRIVQSYITKRRDRTNELSISNMLQHLATKKF